jgi:hypothetical protein
MKSLQHQLPQQFSATLKSSFSKSLTPSFRTWITTKSQIQLASSSLSTSISTSTSTSFSCSQVRCIHSSTPREIFGISNIFGKKKNKTEEDVKEATVAAATPSTSESSSSSVKSTGPKKIPVHKTYYYDKFHKDAIKDPRFYNPIYDLLPIEKTQKFASAHKSAVLTHSLTNAHSKRPTVPYDIAMIRVLKNVGKAQRHRPLSPSQHIIRYLLANGPTTRHNLFKNLNSLSSIPVFATVREMTRYLQRLVNTGKVRAKPAKGQVETDSRNATTSNFVYYIRDYSKAPHILRLIEAKNIKSVEQLKEALKTTTIPEAEVVDAEATTVSPNSSS